MAPSSCAFVAIGAVAVQKISKASPATKAETTRHSYYGRTFWEICRNRNSISMEWFDKIYQEGSKTYAAEESTLHVDNRLAWEVYRNEWGESPIYYAELPIYRPQRLYHAACSIRPICAA